MSDSDDFGGLSPTTPRPTNGKRKARSEKPPSRALDAAGPSNSKPPSNATVGSNANSKKKARTARGSSKKGKQQVPVEAVEIVEEESDIQEIVDEQLDEEEEEAPPPPRQQRAGSKKPPSKDSSAPARTAASSKAKGKQKAQAAVPTRGGRKGNTTDAEDVDVMEVDEDEEVVEVEAVGMDIAAAFNAANGRGPSKAKNKRGTAAANSNSHRPDAPQPHKGPNKSGHDTQLAVENARLKEENERLKGHIDDLKARFEELMLMRQTEPEALMEEMVHAHEAQITVQNELIKDLHTQLAKKEPLLRAAASSGKKAPFSLISREEADEELRDYKAQIQNLRNELVDAKKVVAEKDEEITELKHQVKDVERDLAEEIKRSDQLSKQTRNPPGSATRGNAILKGDDPKHTKVISLYEDLTNILVPTVKYSAKPEEGEEWTFTCIYTWKDDIVPAPPVPATPEKNLNFSLRLCKEPSAEEGKIIDSVHYHPLSLEMETEEFAERLGFLNKPFSFPQTQLSLFVRTLYDNLNNAQDDEDED